MTVPRFYRVLRGHRGNAARTKFLQHLEGLNVESGVGTRGARPKSKTLYVKPFGIDLGATVLLETSAIEASFEKLISSVTAARVKAAIPGGSTSIKIRSAKAARVSASTGVLETGTSRTSKLTGLHYSNYGGKAQSCPFGQGAANEKEGEAFSAIRTALATANFKRIHLIEERI